MLTRSSGSLLSSSAHAASRGLHIALTRLKRRGLEVRTVYDIGAHRGLWTEAVRASLPDARFFLFEANAAHAEALQRTGERYFTVILSSEQRVVDFFASSSPGDSYYRELTDEYAAVEPTTRTAVTLDEMIEEHDLPRPDFIKADVQGAELDVLVGGTTRLRTRGSSSSSARSSRTTSARLRSRSTFASWTSVASPCSSSCIRTGAPGGWSTSTSSSRASHD